MFNKALIVLIIVALSSAAHSDGIWNPTIGGIGNSNGVFNASGGGTPVTPCTQTGLDFTLSCNAIFRGVVFR